jgi:hypothetical protein
MFRRHDRRSPDESARDLPGDKAEPKLDDEIEAEGPKGAEGLPEPEAMDADLESQAADYMADNDVWLYGPNATAVLELLDRLEEVGPDDAGVIADAWKSAPKSDRDAARKAVRKLTEGDEEIARNVGMAREEIGAWLAVAADYPEFAKAVPDWARICSQVGDAALDAATAVILEDELDEPHYEALFLPWTDAIEKIRIEAELDEIEGVEDDGVEDEGVEDEGVEEVEGEFGPNTDAVADFLNRLWLLSPEQVTRLVSSWQEAPREQLGVAHEALHDLVEEDPESREQVRRAQEKITPWLNGGRLQETASFMGQTGQGATRKMAGPALADAVAALVVGDLLAPEDAEVLYAAWFNLVSAPPLPAAADDDGADSVAGKDRD